MTLTTTSSGPDAGPSRAVLLFAAFAIGTAALAPTAQGQVLADYDYENLAFRGIGLDLGYIWPNKVKGTTAWSARVDLGYLGPGIRIAPSLTYWSSSLRAAELDRLAERLNRIEALQEREVEIRGEELGPIDWRDLSFSIDGHYVWRAPGGLLPYVGIGPAIHIMNGRGTAIDDTFVEDLLDSLALGGSALMGLEIRTGGRLRLYGEARYTLMHNLRFPGVRFGGAIMMPSSAGWVGHRGGAGARP